MMKKWGILLICLFALTFTYKGCVKDSDGGPDFVDYFSIDREYYKIGRINGDSTSFFGTAIGNPNVRIDIKFGRVPTDGRYLARPNDDNLDSNECNIIITNFPISYTSKNQTNPQESFIDVKRDGNRFTIDLANVIMIPGNYVTNGNLRTR